MFSVRLPDDLEEKIKILSEKKNLSKSEIVREALQDYMTKDEATEHPYDLGRDLFGQHSSGDGNLSETYKKRIKEKIREKRPD
ncbi:MAG: ribbon-helix-helix protein, CopG family [Firmicutes bacterium]|nr:ribbon-helix-helix protein, CopG family [Bacillota bacterium]